MRSESAGREPWREARRLLAGLLSELGIEPEVDEAGNLWARLEGANPRAPALVLGSHLDSVPDGGWLDGALGVMAALGVLRAYAEGGRAASAAAGDRRLGRRGGRALRAQPLRQLGVRGNARSASAGRAARRRRAPDRDVLGEHGVELAQAPPMWRAPDGARRLPRAAHRAGAADGGRGGAGGRGQRLRRGRALPLRLPRPGGPRRDDPDRGPPRRRARRGDGGAGDRAACRRRGGGRDHGRAPDRAGDRDRGRRARHPLGRPAPSRGRGSGADAGADERKRRGPPPTPAVAS